MPEVDNAGVNENGDDVEGDDGVTLKFTWRMSSCRQPSARARKARTRKGAAEYLAMRSILDDDGDVVTTCFSHKLVHETPKGWTCTQFL